MFYPAGRSLNWSFATLVWIFCFDTGLDVVQAQPQPSVSRGVEALAKSRNESPRFWALLVGVDDYVMLQDLQFAGRDVQLLKKRLVSSGFSEERVFLLSSREADASRQPFRSNIVDQLDYLLGTLNERGERLEKPGVVRQGDHVVIVSSNIASPVRLTTDDRTTASFCVSAGVVVER